MKYLKTFENFDVLCDILYVDSEDLLEELNIQGTYLTKRKDDKEKLKQKIKEKFDSIVKQSGLKLPIEKWGKDFIEIKNQLLKELTHLNKYDFMKEYLNENGEIDFSNPYIKKTLNTYLKEFLIEFCSGETKQIKSKKVSQFDLKKVRFDYKLKSKQSNEHIYQVILPDDVKQYIIKNKDVNYLDSVIYISCESDNFNRIHFGGRIERRKIFKSHDKLGKQRSIMSYGTEYLGKSASSYELLQGIPSSIKGLGLGYLMYKQFIQYLGYASSTKGSSEEAQMVWQKLSNDDDLSGLILNLKMKDKDETWGKILMFDKNFKGDFKKICHDFIKASSSDFKVLSINLDEFLKSKGVSDKI